MAYQTRTRVSLADSRVTLVELAEPVTDTSSSPRSKRSLDTPATTPRPTRRRKVDVQDTEEIKVNPPKREKSASPSKAFKLKLDVAHPEPKRWKETYEILEKQRRRDNSARRYDG